MVFHRLDSGMKRMNKKCDKLLKMQAIKKEVGKTEIHKGPSIHLDNPVGFIVCHIIK